MRITIIGASAGVGAESVKMALERSHAVTALSRSEIPFSQDSNLTIVKGSATNKMDLKESIKNADAVIVALGTGNSRKATTLYSDFARLLTEVQAETSVQIPFIILTGFGAGESAKYNSFFMKLLFRFLLKEVYADKTKMEEIIAASKIKWVIVRPGRLEDKPYTGKYKAETQLYDGIKIGAVSRADAADYLIKQAENPTALGNFVSLSNS